MLAVFTTSVCSYAQTVIPLAGFQGQITTSPSESNDTITATFLITDFSNNFIGTDLSETMNIVVWKNCQRYEVTELVSLFANEITLKLHKGGNTTLNTGVCAILQETESLVSHLISGITDSDRQCIDSYYRSLGGGGGMDSLYNGDRVISRVMDIGDNFEATTFREWLDWHYIGNATNPTLTMNYFSPTVVEVGTSNNYTLSGTLTNVCDYTITTQLVDATPWSGISYSKAITFAPTTAQYKTYSASAAWNNTGSICAAGGSSSGTATASRSVSSVHPVLWGMSATVYNGGSVPYSIWSKRIISEGNQTGLTMTGTNEYIYILIPKSWSDYTVNSIIDANGFDVTPSFTAYDVSVTSTGLVNNWTQDYKLYKLNNLTTASGAAYIYNR